MQTFTAKEDGTQIYFNDWHKRQPVIFGINAFSATDLIQNMKQFDIPASVSHRDDAQVVPIDATGRDSAKLVKGGKLIVDPGGPKTHKDKGDADLLNFLDS